MSEGKSTAIYITLVCVGVVLTTVFVMMLMYNTRIFMLLLILYLIGYSIFIFVFLMLKKQQLKDDIRYDVGKYVSLFNMFFGASVFILTVVFMSRKGGTSSPYSL